MKKKEIFLSAAVLLCTLGLVYLLFATPLVHKAFGGTDTGLAVRTRDKQIQMLQNDSWQPFEVRGVNMGSAAPGLFPNEGRIPRETYLEWFTLIRDMHANTIRVYMLQAPEFYAALAQFNKTSPEKLYLIQTIDFPDQMMYTEKNLLDSTVHAPLLQSARDTVDALHGDLIHLNHEKNRMEFYLADVSDYVLGYVLGIEWDEVFVDFVNRMNPYANYYQGTFLATAPEASPFEAFLARWGDALLTHEYDQYGQQKLLSICNWADTDPFLNELQVQLGNNPSLEPNTEVQVDAEHILATPALQTGLFASYNVYPYYPLFLQYGEYTRYPDETGHSNPYLKYLTDLVEYHTCPVVITEYGLPASRSKAHEDIWRGYTHGGLNEVEQGHAIAALYQDIRAAGCAGSLVFTWQDEWYKRTWNEKMISDPDGRAFWCNKQSSEQHFGLLAFEPGVEGHTFYPDGHTAEWEDVPVVLQQDGMTLRMHTDEAYVHFLLDGLDPGQQTTIVLDTLPGAGVTESETHTFSRGVEFLIRIHPKDGISLLVHDDYSLLIYSMADKMHSGLNNAAIKDLVGQYGSEHLTNQPNNAFHTVRRASGSIYSFLRHALDVDKVGVLTEGNANPASPDYNSNADYFISGRSVEIRIPWQLLNFRDPSRSMIVDDLYENDHAIRSRRIDAIYAGIFTEDQTSVTQFGTFPLKGWKNPTWYPRPKASYYILQSAFEGAK